MSSSPKERCKYWRKCFRKNKDHLAQYLHPFDKPAVSPPSSSKKGSETSSGVVRKSDKIPSSSNPAAGQKLPDKNKLSTVTSTKSINSGRGSSSSTSVKTSPISEEIKRWELDNSSHSIAKTAKLSVVTSTKSITVNPQGIGGSSSSSGKRNLISEEIKRWELDPSTRIPHSGPEERKRRRITPTIRHDRYYFTKVVGHPDKFSDNIALSFRDILSLDGRLTKTWQFTYVVDLDWLLEEYPDNAAEGPIFLFLGEKQATEVQNQIMQQKKTTSQPRKYSRIIVVPVSLPLSYGTHHTKLMILQSEHGIRVVVHTANLIQVDWTVKSQGVWVSPLCPLLSEGEQNHDTSDNDPDCFRFSSYLLKYLGSYSTSATDQLVRILKKYDMTGVTQVKLVGGIPGMHNDSLYGTLRLQKLLSLYVEDSKVRPGWRIVANCSSIGSLGSTASEWFEKFARALQTTNSGVDSSRQALFQLVFPTVDMIRNSLEGYCGGGSVPYHLATHRRQPWLRDHMCHWESKEHGRSRVVPHIKSYTRLSPDMKSAAWFLLTSANLSKAAWGQLLPDGRFRIRSYELGVLFVKGDPQKVYNKENSCGTSTLVPYSLPPRPYSKTDKPWIADLKYSQLDTHGNKWPVDTDNQLFKEVG